MIYIYIYIYIYTQNIVLVLETHLLLLNGERWHEGITYADWLTPTTSDDDVDIFIFDNDDDHDDDDDDRRFKELYKQNTRRDTNYHNISCVYNVIIINDNYLTERLQLNHPIL